MRVTPCVRFATFILAILFARTVSLGLMPEEDDQAETPAPAPPLVSILKDTKKSVRHAHYVDRVKLLIIINNTRTIKQTSVIAPSEHANPNALGVLLPLRGFSTHKAFVTLTKK